MPDLRPRELWAITPLIALIIELGVYPKPILDIINPAVHSTLVGTHSTDPVPPHPAVPVSPVRTTSLQRDHGRITGHAWASGLAPGFTPGWAPGLAQATPATQPVLKSVLTQGSSG
jgi:hypothetical protein